MGTGSSPESITSDVADSEGSGRASGAAGGAQAGVQARGQAVEGSEMDDLKELERILGLDVEDAPEPMQERGSRRNARGAVGVRGAMSREEGEEEGVLWGMPADVSVQQQIAQLSRRGRISEAAARAIKVYDLDALPEDAGKGEGGDAEPGEFAFRSDRTYYPGQFYGPEVGSLEKNLGLHL